MGVLVQEEAGCLAFGVRSYALVHHRVLTSIHPQAGVPIEELEKADRGTLARTISWVERVLAKSPGARWALQLLAGYVCMVVMANLVRFLLHPHVFPGGEGEGESGGGDEGLLASLRGAAGLGRAQDDDDEF
jgi:hypothetical protein